MKRKLFPVGALTAAAWILFNPNISIADPLPDFIAYALILYALRYISSFVPYIREAAGGFRNLLYLSIAKLPAFFIVLPLINTQERIAVTFTTFAFAALELLFLIPAVSNLFEGLFYLGERFHCEAAIREPRYKDGVDTVRTMTYVFVIAKAALSALPDLALLFAYDPLTGKGFSISNIQYALLLAVAGALSLAIGIVWLTVILPYFRALANDEGIAALRSPLCEDMGARERARIRLSLPYFLFALGIFFSIDLIFDNKDILPDPLAAVAFLLLALLFFKRSKRTVLPLIASGLYLAATVLFAFFRSRFFSSFIESDLMKIPAADEAYLPVLVTSGLSEGLFVLSSLLLAIAIGRFYRENTIREEPKTDYEHRLLLEERKRLKRRNLFAAILTALAAAASFLSVLLARYTKAVPTHPGYGGTAPYMPLMGAFWLFPFLLSTVLFLLAAIWGKSHTGELYHANDLDDESISAIE